MPKHLMLKLTALEADVVYVAMQGAAQDGSSDNSAYGQANYRAALRVMRKVEEQL